MSFREKILNALIEESEAIEKARGEGVQGKTVTSSPKPNSSESSKNVKLDQKQKTVGGDSGGVTGGGKNHGGGPAMDNADGKGIEDREDDDCGCFDGTSEHVKDNGDAGTNAARRTRMNQAGNGIQNKNIGKVKTRVGGGAQKMDQVGGEGVQSRAVSSDGTKNGGVRESKIIELPHDTLVEENGKNKVLPKGTKVVVEMFDDGSTPEPTPFMSNDEVEAISYEDDEDDEYDYNVDVVSDEGSVDSADDISMIMSGIADDIRQLKDAILSDTEEEYEDEEADGTTDDEDIDDFDIDDGDEFADDDMEDYESEVDEDDIKECGQSA